MRRLVTTTPGTPNPEFARLASENRIKTVVAALERNGIKASVVGSGDEARGRGWGMLPAGVLPRLPRRPPRPECRRGDLKSRNAKAAGPPRRAHAPHRGILLSARKPALAKGLSRAELDPESADRQPGGPAGPDDDGAGQG